MGVMSLVNFFFFFFSFNEKQIFMTCIFPSVHCQFYKMFMSFVIIMFNLMLCN